MKENLITALYERLSRDDDLDGESNSIVNQKLYLQNYADEHGFANCKHYTDDGWSGGNFDRPGWKSLIADVEAGKVGVILAKDMSRIGRNYLETGFYTEVVFRKHNVRFIAIANGVDNDHPETGEFVPFLNIMNEWYLKDQSKKVTAAYQLRGKSGLPTNNNCLYGYRKDPDIKHHWLVDDEAAANPLTGLVYCADCGQRLYNHRRGPQDEQGVFQSDTYNCSTYMRSRKRETLECTSHHIATKALRALILKTIQTVSRYALSNEVEFARKVREASELQQAQAAKKTKARIRKAQKRCKELDVLIQKLYESYALEKISEKRFDDFLAAYEKEQAELKAVLETDTEELRAYEVDSDHIASFLKLARKYREADELTTPMIYAFVEKIIVHAPEKIDGERHMQIDIYLKFIGNFQVPQDEPTAEEMAEEEKQKQRRAKNREKVARCMERKKLKDAQEKEDAAHENDSAV